MNALCARSSTGRSRPASISFALAAPPAKAPPSRTTNTCVLSKSPSRRRADAFRCLRARAATTPAKSSELIADLRALGVSGILSVTPYYNKPTQEGLYQHYRAIAESTSLPIVVYSVQPRTAVNVEPATMLRLAEIPNIVGVKEASGSISQMASITGSRAGIISLYLSGDDAVALPLIALGGRGVISVVSNQIPAEFARVTRAPP